MLGSEGPCGSRWDRLVVVRDGEERMQLRAAGLGLASEAGIASIGFFRRQRQRGKIEENRRWDSEEVIDRLPATG